MKTVGIIGGLGPETTAEFYLETIFSCYQQNKDSRPPVLIWNVPLKYKIEEDLLTKASGEERYIPYLIDAAKKLEKSGADFLVMPCNSLHVFIDDIRKAVKIPVLSIVEETTKFLKSKNIPSVGVLATSTLLKGKLYESALGKEKIKQIVPDGFEQAKIGKLIKNIVMNRHENRDRKELLKIVNNFEKKGLEHVILACTDLQLLIPEHSKIEIYDTMKIFVNATVKEILK
ncbi:MAG: amino acid racemase [Nanoarchaeota archaeon]|nr:amino acid racemase [Nanoarchaeota archaeon]MBU1135668.1 amino acid racemase [Nanoarchaeota archaeon]MBU2520542.1 amino acid racemase [Nanoarchaeota archaeon]